MKTTRRILVLTLLAGLAPACGDGSGGSGGGGSLPVTISLTASLASPTSATLTWTDSHPDGNQYSVFRNGAYLGDAFAHSLTLTDLAPGTTYSFQVHWDVFPVGALETSNVAWLSTP